MPNLFLAPPIGRASNLLLRTQDRGDPCADRGLGGMFELVPSPPAGLEPATGTLTLPVVSMIEDTIDFLRIKSWVHQTEWLRHSRSPLYSLALVASVLYGR